MAVEGFDYLYLETRDWGKARAFWEALGWTMVLDLENAGRLEPPDGGPGVFLQEVDAERPLASGILLRVGDPEYTPPPEVTTVGEPITSHWGTRLTTLRDPDGREFMLQWSFPETDEQG